MNSPTVLVDHEEAMRQLGGIGRTLLYELIHAGQIENVKIGRRSFVTTRSIAAYVDRLAQTAAV